uniref:Microtubule-associated protein n=1 Tax=Echinostoma caproni TaxID=27848 RepID=A0A183B951_9TREM
LASEQLTAHVETDVGSAEPEITGVEQETQPQSTDEHVVEQSAVSADHEDALTAPGDIRPTEERTDTSGVVESAEVTEASSHDLDEHVKPTTTTGDVDHFRDAHHNGGERPPSVDLGGTVTYHSEEHGGDAADGYMPTDNEGQVAGQLMSTAHHGVEMSTMIHPPPDHSEHEV